MATVTRTSAEQQVYPERAMLRIAYARERDGTTWTPHWEQKAYLR